MRATWSRRRRILVATIVVVALQRLPPAAWAPSQFGDGIIGNEHRDTERCSNHDDLWNDSQEGDVDGTARRALESRERAEAWTTDCLSA